MEGTRHAVVVADLLEVPKQQYNSGDDVEDDNKESFIEKESQKIREKGKAAYFRRAMYRCPYCTTKPKPRDGISEHLMSHACGLSRSDDQDIKTRVEHASLMKALGCYGCFYFASLMLWQDVMAGCYGRLVSNRQHLNSAL
ncbi:hypothetical protein D1007_59207 [Hordeum vulgare]|nr:hypothetical protein D1007_59207 [Hordeum vulgare]